MTTAPFTWPALASLFTGLYPPAHGVRTHAAVLPSSCTTLAEVLRQSGYRTGAIVAHPILPSSFGYGQGFDTYSMALERRLGSWEAFSLFRIFSALLPPPRGDKARPTTDAALRWLEQNGGHRFFLWIHYLDPHRDYEPPLEYVRALGGDASRIESLRHYMKGLRQLSESKGGKLTNLDLADITETITNQHLEAMKTLYDAEIAYTDAEIGRLQEYLNRRGLGPNTIVIATADHGEGLGDHGEVVVPHGSYLYDATLRVPLILRGPGVPGGIRIADQVSHVDLLPTILDLVGAPTPPSVQGRSAADLLHGQKEAEPREAFAESEIVRGPRGEFSFLGPGGAKDYFSGIQGKRRALRTGGWKIIFTPRRSEGQFELYNLLRDPGETRNLMLIERDVGERLKARLLQWVIAAEQGRRQEETAPVTPEMRDRLKALGYLD
jgi:arylsulfatase A-like enzyme